MDIYLLLAKISKHRTGALYLYIKTDNIDEDISYSRI